MIVLAFSWITFWVLNLLLNGRLWLWELFSIVPGWFWGACAFALTILSILFGDFAAVIILVLSTPLWWRSLDFHWQVKESSRMNTETKQLRFFNWNTEHWFYPRTKREHIDYLLKAQAQVYHLQEAWSKDHESYNAEFDLRDHFPGFQIVQSQELVTMTSLPITGHRSEVPYLRVDVKLNGHVVSFYNVHISVHLRPKLLKISLRTFLGDIRARFYKRKEEYAKLAAELASNPNPKVISGDFNTTAFMPILQQIYAGKSDAFAANHKGFAATFYASYTFRWWRIDYVLGEGVDFHSYKSVDPLKLSDHWGQFVELSPTQS